MSETEKAPETAVAPAPAEPEKKTGGPVSFILSTSRTFIEIFY
jgi:hypothetical protein